MPQTSQTPEIVVTHVTSKEDIIGLLRVEESAFGPSPIMSVLFNPSIPAPPKKDGVSEHSIHNYQNILANDPTARYQKAVLPDGTIVGMAKWNFILDSTEPMHIWELERPANLNHEFADYFFGGMKKKREEVMAGKRHFLMEVLAVSPEYQRMGVGDKLLAWGLSEADRLGVECWIEASPFGLGLYKKKGWVEIEHVDVDLGRWGGEEGKTDRLVYMVRPPKGGLAS
ncbi:hypothetical protein D0Z07_4391 [Hyphodiscus hymeniophilus]|uniref:N-acetyltransferase domain-containing protein n=1 Tax=Hyphodiscus hymeniophilus TaxID=353542 RepID=A0A9P7AX98_9HELO|nr:hypothetical protein D0Z07_4391 [Hyphodiscus hymeniophilus]